jgi:hypothetical protein
MWSLVSAAYRLYNYVVFWHRNSEKSQRSQLDLCVVVFRTRSPASPEVGRLVEHSKRQVRGFVGCHKMLERDLYILVCLAFNHWHTGKLHLQAHNSYVCVFLLQIQKKTPKYIMTLSPTVMIVCGGCRYCHILLRC